MGDGSGLSTALGMPMRGVAVLIVSVDFFSFSARTVELLSIDAFPSGISSSTIVAALLFPLTVLAGDARPFLVEVDSADADFFSATLRTTVFLVGVALILETVLLTDAMLGGRRTATGLGDFLDADSDGASDEAGDGLLAFEVVEFTDEAADGTRGRVSVIFPVEGPCVLLLLLDKLLATDVLRVGEVAVNSDWALLNVVLPSLVLDKDDVGRGGREDTGREEVGREAPLAGGGRRLWRGEGGVLERGERREDATEGASDFGLLALLAIEGERDEVLGVRGVTFVTSVFLDGVTLGDRLPATLERTELDSVGVSFESGRGSLAVSVLISFGGSFVVV